MFWGVRLTYGWGFYSCVLLGPLGREREGWLACSGPNHRYTCREPVDRKVRLVGAGRTGLRMSEPGSSIRLGSWDVVRLV